MMFLVFASLAFLGLPCIISIYTEDFYRQCFVLFILIGIILVSIFYAPHMEEAQKNELERLQNSLVERGLATFTLILVEKQKKFELLPVAEKEIKNENK